jgi:dephospho-CoA kinase
VGTERQAVVVGLTGAIGAGKSTVASLLAEKGAAVIDADALGREVWETSPRLRAGLAEAFGPQILAPDGDIDRKALAREAFASEKALARLNEVVHPLLWKRLRAEIAAQRNVPLVVVDAALIVEWGRSLPVDVVVVVDAPEGIRKERSRLKYEERDFYARQTRQLDAPAKRAAADIIIENGGSQAELAAKTELLYKILAAIAKGDELPGETLVI